MAPAFWGDENKIYGLELLPNQDAIVTTKMTFRESRTKPSFVTFASLICDFWSKLPTCGRIKAHGFQQKVGDKLINSMIVGVDGYPL